MVLEHLQLDVGHVGGSSPVPVKLGLDLISGRDARPIHIDGELAATLDVAAQRYRFAALHVKGSYAPRTGVAPLPFDFSVPELNLDLAGQSMLAPKFSLELAAARLQGAIAGRRIVDAPNISGSFQLAPLALRDYMVELGVTPPVTRDARALSRLTGSGKYAYGGGALRTTQLNMRMDDSTLRGSAAITNLDTLASSFDLALDRIDIDRYRSPASAASAPPKPATKPGEPPNTTPLKSLTTSGTMRIGEATISGMKVTNVSIGIHAKDGITRIAPAQAQLYGGQYSGVITLDERSSQSVLSIDQTMTSVDVAPLLDDFAKTKRLSGRGNLNSHLSAHGQTGDELIKTLSGHVDANLANGALEGIDLWYEMNRAQSLLKQQALPSGTSTGRTAFDTFRASADIRDGVATTKDLNITSALLHLTGQGFTNLVSQVIDYDIKATVLKSAPAAAHDSSGLTLAEIPVKISGTISHPTVRPDLEAIAKKRLQQELDKHKDELQQKLQDQLKNLIKR
jgi:AsmA protein